MSKKIFSRFELRQSTLRAFALVGVWALVSSCASTSSEIAEGEAPSLPVSEASLLSDSEKTESADSTIFADLEPGKENKDSSSAEGESTANLSSGSGAFYNAIGGESLGQVAYVLYGDRSFRKQLAEKNAELGVGKKLSLGQQVFFDFEQVKPQPTFLTKDLLDRYPTELSEKMKAAGAAPGTVTVEKGETLQMVSQRLYGTTRYWTELYLLNHGKLNHYDKVAAGMTLATGDHTGAAAAPLAQASSEEKSPPPSPAKMEPAYVDNTAPVAQPTMDPIPDMSQMETAPVASAPAPEPVSAASPPAPTPTAGNVLDSFGETDSTNLRRIVYVALIVAIGGLAFYFTRPKRKQGVDMLDVTAGSTAPVPRSKLGTKDTSRKGIG